jgi:RimJ/RimL family protein N-acetyltransferase
MAWETDRLILRRFREDDLEGLFELHGDPAAMHFLGVPWTKEKTRETLAKIIANYEKTDLDWHAVERKSDSAMIGVCWLGRLGARWDNALGPGHIELGYRYAKRFWGNGYASEAGAAMLRRGFDELKLPQIVAICDVLNTASDRVIQKLGMQYQKTFEQEGLTIKFYTLDRSPL